MDILKQIFTQEFVAQLVGVLALVVADLLFGVWVAVKEGKFDLRKIGDFYKTTVLPYVLGWVTLVVLVKVIAIFALTDISPVVPATIEAGAYAILLLTLGSGLFDKFRALWGKVPGQGQG